MKGFLKLLEIYKDFCLIFTTGYLGIVVFGLVLEAILQVAARLKAWQGRCRQAKDYANQGDRFLCPVCFNLNNDNFPVITATGRTLEGGCMECWLKTTATPQSPNFSPATTGRQAPPPARGQVKELYSPLPDPTDYTSSIMVLAERHRQKGSQN